MSIRVGARTNIQDNAVVHITSEVASTTIGDDVTIGHAAIVHGCTIGNACLIGMGSIVLDDAEVGEGSVVAAGSLVPPRMKIPPRSLVMGNPAKVVRGVREGDAEMAREAAGLYVGYARTFRSEDVKVVEG
jgi:carbonic anhydrase/acetyltransferase-like protein (isoleucine patch superfamily)